MIKALFLSLVMVSVAAGEEYNLFHQGMTLSAPIHDSTVVVDKRVTPEVLVVMHNLDKVVSIYGTKWVANEKGVLEKKSGSGTGFIVDKRGYIITAYHVAGLLIPEEGIEVLRFGSAETVKATLVGVDKKTDVAVLKIEGTDLPTVKFELGLLWPGERAITIGNARGFPHSIQVGNIAGLSRQIEIKTPAYSNKFDNLVQTNSIIYPGNSGGPVFNINGDVIGMCDSTFNEGEFGFIVPSADVRRTALTAAGLETFE